MHIRDFFTVPADKKISDKAFARVLISSICGILLCTCCLAGTTWAWFIAGVENPNNVITIATVTAQATILQGEDEIVPEADGSYTLPTGAYTLLLSVDNNATTAQPVYVLMTVSKNGVDTTYYRAFSDTAPATVAITVEDGPIAVRFATRWSQPVALPLTDTLSDSEAQVPITDATTTTTTLPAEDVTTSDATTATDTVIDTTTTATESTTTTDSIATESSTAETETTTALPTTETTEVVTTTEATETQPTDLTEE